MVWNDFAHVFLFVLKYDLYTLLFNCREVTYSLIYTHDLAKNLNAEQKLGKCDFERIVVLPFI